MDKRIKYLKSIYPNVKYINNHTGSKFTQNHKAMNRLMKILKKYDYYFIDSKTTSKSVVKKYAKKYNVPSASRNIFLDNKKDKNYIQNQLRKAVLIAKRNGSAIAICHPYSITFRTLKESIHIVKGVNLVYINKIKLR
jgi:polysaccharide deacetylase 2 family uncharacterized protein YibQ